MDDLHSRRSFLNAALAAGAGWATADVVSVENALAWAAQQATAPVGASFTALTAAQGETLDAVTARLIPSVDGRPGAREAGASHFIDRALATFNASQKRAYADGLADLNRRAAARSPGTQGFARLTPALQDEVIREVEATPFFQMLRFDTIVGTFALPSRGANRDYAGWHLIGFEHRPRFQAPFGYYDANLNERG